MSDAEVIKQIMESKENQKLREDIQNNTLDEKSKEKYEQMTETEKATLMNKGWKNG